MIGKRLKTKDKRLKFKVLSSKFNGYFINNFMLIIKIQYFFVL